LPFIRAGNCQLADFGIASCELVWHAVAAALSPA
jgi:hypothetical protein